MGSMLRSCDGDGLMRQWFGEAQSRRHDGGRTDQLGVVAAARGAGQGEEDVAARPADNCRWERASGRRSCSLPSLGRMVRPSFGFGSSARTPRSLTSQVSRVARTIWGSWATRAGLGARKRAPAGGGLGTEVGEGSAAYIAGQLGLCNTLGVKQCINIPNHEHEHQLHS
jgi:hypothetical protein